VFPVHPGRRYSISPDPANIEATCVAPTAADPNVERWVRRLVARDARRSDSHDCERTSSRASAAQQLAEPREHPIAIGVGAGQQQVRLAVQLVEELLRRWEPTSLLPLVASS
jgi:hypothetical protein